ncbi:hypothetical protein N7492_000854 [Penicillium capsulatum]|uniref:ferric-chelate reductase (NADPH) n=1 Tax=Penicillium capsulatum TaxID=69766 RepID=A0A9W9IQC7_9EURO|nr:hypothetical protein N7492_000854 [Penicillium capsulatum]KAJ6130088.1 hypothetical protein N7512_002868 [Penicillium capsulatum]
MDIVTIYAIAAGGIFVAFFFIQTLSSVTIWADFFRVFVSRHLMLPFVIRRHRLWGPWNRAGMLLHLTYVAVNLLLIFFKIKSLVGAGRRAGELALVNLVFPLSAIHLSYLADLLGITWKTCRKIHRATGWMAVFLLSFHIIVAFQTQAFTFPLREVRNLFTLLAAISLGLIVLLSLPSVRRLSYEIFLRAHQVLAGLFVYGIWQHLPSHSHSSEIYLLVALGVFGLSLLSQSMVLLYRNGLFSGRGTPRAIVSFSMSDAEEGTVVNAVHIRVLLPRPVRVEAGQYINLWMPSVSLCSWMQTHPFTIMSWSKGKQNTLELLVKPRSGLTANLARYARIDGGSSISFLALFTGPHGVGEEVGHCETILLLASGSGIAGAIPYLKKTIYGYNTCTSQIRRLHLTWQVESIGEMSAALILLNNLLKDDIMDSGYILHISIYVRNGLGHKKLPFGQHERVYLYQGVPDYQSIISLEASGTQIERLPNMWDEQGRMLILVSAKDELRDRIREVVREYLHDGVKLSELEYQPSD